MNEERCIELIHAEIDGELNLHDRAGLNRHLLANPAAMRLRDELKQVCMILDGVEQIAPPPDLRDSILQKLNASGLISGRLPKSHRKTWFAPTSLRYAAAFAAGLALGAVAFNAATLHQPPADFSELAGTMAAPGSALARSPGDTLDLELDGLRGAVYLRQTGPLLMLEFKLESARPVQVVALYDGHEARFDGVGRSENHFGLVLTRSGPDTAEVTVKFLSDGSLVHEDLLRLPKGR